MSRQGMSAWQPGDVGRNVGSRKGWWIEPAENFGKIQMISDGLVGG
jgi:hypothetical protein